MNSRSVVLLAALCLASPIVLAEEKVDLAVVNQIKTEAFAHGEVMDHLFYLADVYGPRLVGSPGYKAASEWAVKEMKGWGLDNVHLEKWGDSGQGWTWTGLDIRMTKPVESQMMGIPKAWCAGTNGPVRGDVVAAPLFTDDKDPAQRDIPELGKRIQAFIEQYRGKLRGKVVLLDPIRKFEQGTEPPSSRYGREELASYADAPPPAEPEPLEWPLMRLPVDRAERAKKLAYYPTIVMEDFWTRMWLAWEPLHSFLVEEGVAAVLRTDDRGNGGIIFAEEEGYNHKGAPVPPPTIVVLPEQYNRLVRLVDHEIPVEVEVDLAARYVDDHSGDYDVIAEIPGGSKKDEIVMLGAHLDSWHGGTGATDNGAGSAVVMEAMRILKSLNLKMDRTVRAALWGSEEQGLFGSHGYVVNHFADPITMELKPEHAKLAAYFNLDNGSGKIRGVHLQGNDMVRPIFEAWLKPFADLGATTLTIRNTGGTDHLFFDDVGLPGFQFVQDGLEYGSTTHHSNVDTYDRAVPADLMQAAAIMASFVYNAATRPEMLPREPLPPPMPPKKEP